MLDKIFTSKTQIQILKLFFQKPTNELYQREIAKILSKPLANIQYELKKMEKIKLIRRREKRNRVYYRLNQEFLFYPELRDMLFKAAQNDLI